MSETLEQRLVRHEGLRLKPYRDTAGKLTIGVGRNLDDVGIAQAEAMTLLATDIARADKAVADAMPWAEEIDPARREVLVEMAFNMGIERLLSFSKMLSALQAGDAQAASAEMLNSAWAQEVGARATELAQIMATGD